MTMPPVHQRRRAPKPEQLRAWRSFIETSEAVRAAIGSRLLADTGLSMGDYGVLLALSEAQDNRLSSSKLADSIHWERSRLSHHLGRMERRGLVERHGGATDNRSTEVTLTAAGTAAFRKATGPHLRVVQEYFVDALTPEQLSSMERAAQALQAHLDGVADQPRA